MKARTAAWIGWAAFGLGVLLVGVDWYLNSLEVGPLVALRNRAGESLITIPFGAIGALIVSRRPDNIIGWIFCGSMLVGSMDFLGNTYERRALVLEPGSLPGGIWVAWFDNLIEVPLLLSIVFFLPMLFPNGKLVSPRWKWAVGLAILTMLQEMTWAAFSPEALMGTDPVGNDVVLGQNPLGIEAFRGPLNAIESATEFLFPLLLVIAIASIVVRYRRSHGDERQQVKWVLFSIGISIAFFLLLALEVVPLRMPEWAADLFFGLIFMMIPISAGISILKHRLYDIDVVINKTLVFAALAAFITAAYLGVVVGIGALVGSRSNLALSVLATALIAVAFQPVRERARHLANRLVYGKRATPYEVLSEFSQRMGGGYSTEEILPQLTQILAEGTGAARTEVWLRVGSELHSVAAWPTQPAAGSVGLAVSAEEFPGIPDADAAFAVRDQGELLGAISMQMPPGEPLTPAGEKLASDLASQAALVLRNVRLLAELRASRQRIVAAQDEERRRLERDIHDAAQQQLVALAVKAGLARNLLDRDTQKTARILDEIKIETHEIVETVRELARGVFPPVLAEKGIVSALRSDVTKMGINAKLETDSFGDARFNPQTEAAVYFCIREALQNASKHAPDTPITISFSFKNGSLEFSVRDQGPGFDPETVKAGSGLQNMVDRIEAIGGLLSFDSAPGRSTTVRGRVPIRMNERVS